MKYLITGGNGFLGSHLGQFLEDKGIEYIATVRDNPGRRQIATGNLLQYADWAKLLNGVDVVIHTAAKAHDMSGRPELKTEYYQNNFELTRKLALLCKHAKVKKFIFISSIKVNGEFTSANCFTPEDTPNPTDDYGKSKLMGEEEVLKLNSAGEFEVTVIRPCLVYGKGVKANFNALTKLVGSRLPLPFGMVNNRRSFVSVGNLCDFIFVCANNSNAAGEIFLVSDGQDLSLAQLIKKIASALGKKALLIPAPVIFLKFLLFVTGKSSMADRLLANLCVDISKNRRLLNWDPPNSTEKEILKMLS